MQGEAGAVEDGERGTTLRGRKRQGEAGAGCDVCEKN